ncbi:MAG: response regulator [Deltaproteobacteria bacterium]
MKVILRRRKKRILIIDDEVSFSQLVKLNLEATGKYEVRTEEKGSLGLVAAKQFKPDLILLDLIMQDMGGGEVSCRLKIDEETKNIPIVYLTAVMTEEEVEARGGIVSGLQVVAKPVGTGDLINVVEKNTQI